MSESKHDDGQEEALADVAGFVLAGRPERVDDGILALAPPELRAGTRNVRELLVALALAESPTPPSPDVRTRVIATLSSRKTRRALVIVDMIHDHLDPGTLLEVPRARAVVPALKERIV